MSDLVFIAFPTEQKAEEVRDKILENAERVPHRTRRRGSGGER
jgi:hypothetical protein